MANVTRFYKSWEKIMPRRKLILDIGNSEECTDTDELNPNSSRVRIEMKEGEHFTSSRC